MKKLITFLAFLYVFLITSVPITTKAVAVQQQQEYDITTDDEITVSELKDYSVNKNGEWLIYVKTWIPRVGALLFVAGIVLAVVSTKSNSQRKWGIRIAVVESIVAFIFYIAACILYDKYYWDGTTVEASSFFVERYNAMKLSVSGLSAAYEQSKALGNTTMVSVLKIIQQSFMEAMIPLAIVSFFIGVGVFLLNPGRRKSRKWALIGLCFIIPTALIVGGQIIR